MIEFWRLYSTVLFDVSNTSYHAEVESCTTSCGHGKWLLKVMESYGKFLGEKCGHPV